MFCVGHRCRISRASAAVRRTSSQHKRLARLQYKTHSLFHARLIRAHDVAARGVQRTTLPPILNPSIGQKYHQKTLCSQIFLVLVKLVGGGRVSSRQTLLALYPALRSSSRLQARGLRLPHVQKTSVLEISAVAYSSLTSPGFGT